MIATICITFYVIIGIICFILNLDNHIIKSIYDEYDNDKVLSIILLSCVFIMSISAWPLLFVYKILDIFFIYVVPYLYNELKFKIQITKKG